MEHSITWDPPRLSQSLARSPTSSWRNLEQGYYTHVLAIYTSLLAVPAIMFSVLDSARANGSTRPRTSADRACDQCKSRKVRCDMTKPCRVCSSKGFTCTYDQARKKRGPTGKRIAEIRRLQSTDERDGMQYLQSPSVANESTMSHVAEEPDPFSLQLTTSVSSNGTMGPYPTQSSGHAPYWTSGPEAQPGASQYSPAYPDMMTSPQQVPTSATVFSEASGDLDTEGMVGSPNQSEFMLPSLPVESPPNSTFDAFGAIPQQDLPSLLGTVDIWPQNINEATLLPWIDVYFKRLQPTIPILNRTNMYRGMLLRKHHVDSQYGAMLLGLCAFASTYSLEHDNHEK